MRDFSKTAKILLVVLAIMLIASIALTIMHATGDKEITIPIIALIGSAGGIVYTYKTAVDERNTKQKENEENADEYNEADYDEE